MGNRPCASAKLHWRVPGNCASYTSWDLPFCLREKHKDLWNYHLLNELYIIRYFRKEDWKEVKQYNFCLSLTLTTQTLPYLNRVQQSGGTHECSICPDALLMFPKFSEISGKKRFRTQKNMIHVHSIVEPCPLPRPLMSNVDNSCFISVKQDLNGLFFRLDSWVAASSILLSCINQVMWWGKLRILSRNE